MMHASIEPLSTLAGSHSDLKTLKKIYLDSTSVTMSEGSIALINVALDEKHDKDIQVTVTLNDPNNRFQAISNTLTIPAQSISKQIILQSIDDTIYQGTQTITLSIAPVDSQIIADPNTLTITLTDNDPQPTVQFASVSQNVSEGTAAISVNINLSSIAGVDVMVPLTLSGTATSGSIDYLANFTSSITIPAGSTSASLNFSIISDSLVEANETVIVAMGTPTVATLGTNSTHTITITDDDVYISINDVSVNENAGTATFTVSLSALSLTNIQVNWSTANGTAIAGTNYTNSSGTLTIPAGNISGTVIVPILDTSGVCEGTRTFNVNLTSPVNGTLQDNQGVGSILENDFPTLSTGDLSIGEAYIASVPLILSQACNIDITVNYSTASNTATAGLDYLDISNMPATIPAGSVLAYMPVLLFNDSAVEGNENFNLTISSPNYGSITTASATVTILDNDVSLSSPNNFIQVSVGGYHTCGVNSAGEVKCWGRNHYGQLANGSLSEFEEVPVTVAGLGGIATKVIAGGTQSFSGFSCAIVAGAAKCWGRNDYGQLGNGNTAPQLTPTQVSGLTANVTDITGGGLFACAVVSGGAKCWGRNDFGQLGNNSTTNSSTPVDVFGLTANVVSISAGQYSACAVLTDGTIQCWGKNNFGQLGNNSTTNSSIPVEVWGIDSGASSVAVSYSHACAIVAGNGFCWGNNGYGQLGTGNNNPSLTPISVSGLSNAASIEVTGDDNHGYSTSCSLQTNGTIYCWGVNLSRLYGTTSVGTSNTKVLNPNFASGVSSISLSTSIMCAVVSGVMKCWGADHYANFARPGHRYNLKPFDAGLPLTVSQISIGGYRSSCAVINGAAKCWGNNNYGQLGNGTTTESATPVTVSGLTSGIVKVAMSGQPIDGHSHACALSSGGALYCWGSNIYGQLGDGTTTWRSSPYTVFSSGVLDFDVSYGDTTCAVMTGGALKCWGRNDYGQLGNNSTTQSTIPINVTGLSSGVTKVSASYTHTCAIVNGGVKCWGANTKGELGIGSTGAPQLTPMDVSGLSSGVTSLSANTEKTCAVVNGGAKCWGYGYNGSLGNGTSTDMPSPTQVTGLTSGVAKIQINYFTVCALMTNGSLKCWGGNYNGELGVGNLTSSLTPVSISGFSSGVVDFDMGYYSNCVLTIGNGVKCWGSNYEGILGIGYSTETAIPVDIQFP